MNQRYEETASSSSTTACNSLHTHQGGILPGNKIIESYTQTRPNRNGRNKLVYPGGNAKAGEAERKPKLTLNVKDEPGPEGAPVKIVVGEPPPPRQHAQHGVHHHPRQGVDDRLHHQGRDGKYV